MKNSKKRGFVKFVMAFGLLLGLSCGTSQKTLEQGVTLAGLLHEMIDRETITRFPESEYKALQVSSYNRESVSPDEPGWFADSDGVGFIRTEENNGKTEWVLMEDEGPGAITKIWAVCFYYGLGNTTGANINIYLDGETTPTISANFFKLVQGKDFVKAPFGDESTRAGNLYLPIPYAKSCKVTMDDRAFYNIINYRKYPEGTPVKTFTMADFKATKALRKEVGDILVFTPDAEGKKASQTKILTMEDPIVAQAFGSGGAIKQIEIKLSEMKNIAQALRSVVLRAEFDGEQTVWAPVGDFFNNVGKSHPYQMWERTVRPDGTMICRWTMPFKDGAKVHLENMGAEPVKASMVITRDDYEWTDNSMYFHATWRMDDPTATFPIYDWNFLEAKGKGLIVGDEWAVLNPIEGWWGEGDEKIYVDDDIEANFPSHFGTGTEDYYGWAGGVVPTSADEFSKPFLGNIIVADPNSKGYNVCTRTRVLDAIPFERQIKFDIESSCGKRSKSHFLQYAQTTFWYAMPGATHNRPALPEKASAKVPTVADLEKLIEKATKESFVVEGALEAEILSVSDESDGVTTANLTKEDWDKERRKHGWSWGEISGDAYTMVTFDKVGSHVTYKLTEQFEKSTLYLGATIDQQGGLYDIYVNGERKATYDFYSGTIGITSPAVNLGECEPVNNAFEIKMVAKVKEGVPADRKTALGLDYFRVENNFLNRQ